MCTDYYPHLTSQNRDQFEFGRRPNRQLCFTLSKESVLQSGKQMKENLNANKVLLRTGSFLLAIFTEKKSFISIFISSFFPGKSSLNAFAIM